MCSTCMAVQGAGINTSQYMADVHSILSCLFKSSYLLLICMKVIQNTIFTVLEFNSMGISTEQCKIQNQNLQCKEQIKKLLININHLSNYKEQSPSQASSSLAVQQTPHTV